MKKLIIAFIIFTLHSNVNANNTNYDIVVAKDSSGNYSTITKAIESLPMYCYERVTIFIKNGIYNEKIKIDRDYVTLIGESRENTRIEYNQVREDWIKNQDIIGPAVVNIFADDIILKNLTIENTQPQIGPHAFAIYGTGTRTILKNCTVLSKGGDTVSLWDYKTGMYYHDSCYFKGAVDFVCPRGWCYISNSTFYEVKQTAAVWHAAPTNPNQKFILQSCDFQGADSFRLARHHYDAQFYFLNCTFPAIMKDESIQHKIYKDNPEKNRPYLYGDRYYFYSCNRTGGNYNWFADNTDNWQKGITPKSITPEWTFDNKWNPVNNTELIPIKIESDKNSLFIWFNELVMTVGNVEIQSETGKTFKYFNGGGRDRLEFRCEDKITPKDLISTFTIVKGDVQNIQATENQRSIQSTFTIKTRN